MPVAHINWISLKSLLNPEASDSQRERQSMENLSTKGAVNWGVRYEHSGRDVGST